MSTFYKALCASLCALSMTTSYADAPGGLEEFMPDAMAELTAPALAPSSFTEPASEISRKEPAPVVQQKIVAKPSAPKIAEAPFTAFTGKVKARKVRMRLQPDLDSRIIKELNKNELLSVVGEKDDFWAVEATTGFKAYIFRSFVLDNVVEGNRVNVRLEPHLEAPIVGHLNSGDKITDGVISAQNNKWLEIPPPAGTRFYVAKDYLEYAGGPEVKVQLDKRRLAVEQLLDANSLLSQAELRKPFEEVDFDRIAKGLNNIIDDYEDFPEYVDQAQEALATFQESYLQKRIDYLESKALADAAEQKASGSKDNIEALTQINDRMRMWEPIEEALYSSWANMNDQHNINQFYDDQKLTASSITGIIESYNSPVKSKPGDFIVRDRDLPVAYVYSTHINLQNLVGKKVTLNVTPRPNHNFAFPAYYVLDVE